LRIFLMGVITSGAISLFFFVQSGLHLQREANLLRGESEKLRRVQELTIYAQTNPKGLIEPTWDEMGKNIIGLTVGTVGSTAGMSSARAELTLTPSLGTPTHG
jgi:hypothetical protein